MYYDYFLYLGMDNLYYWKQIITHIYSFAVNQNGKLKKTEFFKIANFQKKIVKILWIGP